MVISHDSPHYTTFHFTPPTSHHQQQLASFLLVKETHTHTHEGPLFGNPVTSQVVNEDVLGWWGGGGEGGGLTWRSLSNLQPVTRTSALLFLG